MLRLLFTVAFTTLLSLGHPGHAWDPDGPLEIAKSHPAFSLRDGKLYLGTQLFTGIVIQELEVDHPLLVASDIPNAILKARYGYQDGLPHGNWLEWHDNGFMKTFYNYAKGQLSGLQQEWHPNGTQKLKCDYIMGMAYGLERHWSAQGQLIKEVLHEPVVEEQDE